VVRGFHLWIRKGEVGTGETILSEAQGAKAYELGYGRLRYLFLCLVSLLCKILPPEEKV
jgi:hypothetical protein